MAASNNYVAAFSYFICIPAEVPASVQHNYAALMSADSVCQPSSKFNTKKKKFQRFPKINIDLLFWIIHGFQGTPIILKKMLA